ncbi:MAG: twin-arginine translocation signal domain-containing protein, partial [Rhodanobacteraceae bacterium]
MTGTPMTRPSRRDFLSAMAAAGGVATFGLPAFARADETSAKNVATALASHAHDWDWLLGSWDVFHRRL